MFKSRIEHELGIPGGLTSADVARRAVATSYSLEARRAELAAASAEVDRAVAGYVPTLQLLARYTRLSDTSAGEPFPLIVDVDFADQNLQRVELNFDTPVNQYTLQASLTVPVTDYFLRVSKGHAATKHAEAATKKDLAATELATVADARTLYYAWMRSRLGVIVATQSLEDARAHLVDVKHALEAGTASQADVLAVVARVAEGERLVDVGQNLIAELEEQLRIIRHDPPTVTYRVGEALPEEPAGITPERLADLTQTALAQRPEMEALELRAKATQSRASFERAAYYPRVDLFGNVHYDNPNSRVFPMRDEFQGSWDAGVQATWTVTDIPGTAAAVRSQNATAQAILAQRRALTDQIRSEVASAYTALQDARSGIRTSARSLAAAEESHRVRRVLFQNGRATSVEVMDAELGLTRARLVAVAARIDLKIARVRLDYALGRTTPNPS